MRNSTTISTTASTFGCQWAEGLETSDEADRTTALAGGRCAFLFMKTLVEKASGWLTHSGEKPKWPRILHPNCPQPTEHWGGKRGGVQKETGLGLFSEQGDVCDRVSGLSRVLQITLACSEQSKGWSPDLGVRVPGSNVFKRLVLPSRCYAMLCYAKSLQSCLTLHDPIDGSPPGSPVPGEGADKWFLFWAIHVHIMSLGELEGTLEMIPFSLFVL